MFFSWAVYAAQYDDGGESAGSVREFFLVDPRPERESGLWCSQCTTPCRWWEIKRMASVPFEQMIKLGLFLLISPGNFFKNTYY